MELWIKIIPLTIDIDPKGTLGLSFICAAVMIIVTFGNEASRALRAELYSFFFTVMF